MPLVDGDPAAEGDVWYRILTSDKHITKGRIQHAAFQGKFIKPPPPEKNRPWNAEASGRLRSLAGSIDDVRVHCRGYCGKINRSFYGLMFPKEPLAGQTIESLEVGIFYTPIEGTDEAHSDLTFTGNVPFVERSEEHDRLVMALSGKFNALHPDQIALLPDAHVTTEPQKGIERLKAALRSAINKIRG
jgi:hypothetical protein